MHLRCSEFAVRKSIRTDFALAISNFSGTVVFGTVDSVVCCVVSAEVTCLFSEAVCSDAFVVDWVLAFAVDEVVSLSLEEQELMKITIVVKSKINMILCSAYFLLYTYMLDTSIL